MLLKIVFLLGLLMAKYTVQDVKALALVMRAEREADRPFTLITGAGCSVTGGIPLAKGLLKCIDEHAHGEIVRERLKCKNVSDCDYGEAMGCLTPDERKEILGPLLKASKVNWGQIALAGMMKGGFVGRVLTFNFDNILVRAAGLNGFHPSIYDFGVSPADSFDHIETPAILHLHGQGHGLAMLNSAEDTKAHAEKLYPLFKDSFEKANVLVVGYSGTGDQAFEKIRAAFTGRKRLYWCSNEESAPPSHVAQILDKSKNTNRHLEGVDCDTFLIDLATELKVFPLPLFTDTAQLLADEIAQISQPPADLRGAEGLIESLSADLAVLRNLQANKPQFEIRNAMLRRNWNSAIALEGKAKNYADKVQVAWANVMQGNELSNLAKLKNDEVQFRESFKKYEAALKIKPDLHEAQNNWGAALSNLAKIKKNVPLFRESFAKYETALRNMPNDHEVLNNWGVALSDLAEIKSDETLFRESFSKYEAALKIKPDDYKALNNWGTALSGIAKIKNEEPLFRESIAKYQAALKIKPDLHEAMNNWGAALGRLYQLNRDPSLIHDIENLALQVEKITGKPSYNLACAYALQDKETECQAQLLKCKAAGTLHEAAHLTADEDFKNYWERGWFKALVAG